MANSEETLTEESGGKGGLPIKLILVVFIVLILAGGGVLVLKSGLISGGEETAEATTTQKEVTTDIGPIYPLETFIVNLADPRGKKYLKTKLELELDMPIVVQEIDQRLPQFRDTILTILSSKSFEEIQQLEGKYQLRAEIMTMLNQYLTSGEITNIYFTEFIVQ
ncbi:MAG: flagellar basal body-associated FliL family protein [Desulfobacteraceae bacterium]|jgi:flagellar FliL protein